MWVLSENSGSCPKPLTTLGTSFSERLSYLVEERVSGHVEDVHLDFPVSDLDPEMFRWKKVPKQVMLSASTLILLVTDTSQKCVCTKFKRAS